MSMNKPVDSQTVILLTNLTLSLIINGQSSHDPWYVPYTVQHNLLIYLQRELENIY